MSFHTVLIADNDRIRRESLSKCLLTHFHLIIANSGQETLQSTIENQPSLVIINLQNAKSDGLEICQWIRIHEATRNMPIIIMSDNPEDNSKCTHAFLAGADDFILQPVSTHELVARIMSKVCWDRQLKTAISTKGLILGNLVFDENQLKVFVDGHPIKLTFFEYNLIKYLIMHKDNVVSRTKILQDIWKENAVCSRTVDTHLYSLRKKLKDFNHEIITIHSAGFILKPRSKEISLENKNNPTEIKTLLI